MSGRKQDQAPGAVCAVGREPDLSALTQVRLNPETPLAD